MVVLCAVVALLGATHILVRTSAFGLAVGADSVGYLAAAANLLDGEGAQDHRGMRPWPPLYPALLAALAGATGLDLTDAARFLNAASFGATIFAAGLWLRSALRSKALVVTGVALIALALPMTHFASFLLTESVFVLFTLAALLLLHAFLNRQGGWWTLIGAAACAGLASTTRYIGIALVVAATASLLVARRAAVAGDNMPLRRRPWPRHAAAKHAAAFFVISTAAPLSVLLYNQLAFGAWEDSHDRAWSELARTTLQDRWLDAFRPLSRSLDVALPEGMPGWSIALLGLGAVPSVAVMIHCAWRMRAELRHTAPLALYCVVYAGSLAVALPLGSSYGLAPRFLVPLYPPLLLLALAFADDLLRWRPRERSSRAKRWIALSAIAAAGLLHGGGAVAGNVRATARAMDSGHLSAANHTFNTAYWASSETLAYLRAETLEPPIHCNRYGLLYAQSVLRPTDPPAKTRCLPLPKRLAPARELVANAVSEGSAAWIVWLKTEGEPDYLYDDRQLRALPKVSVVADLADGVMLRVSPLPERRSRLEVDCGPLVWESASGRPAQGGRGSVRSAGSSCKPRPSQRSIAAVGKLPRAASGGPPATSRRPPER